MEHQILYRDQKVIKECSICEKEGLHKNLSNCPKVPNANVVKREVMLHLVYRFLTSNHPKSIFARVSAFQSVAAQAVDWQ